MSIESNKMIKELELKDLQFKLKLQKDILKDFMLENKKVFTEFLNKNQDKIEEARRRKKEDIDHTPHRYLNELQEILEILKDFKNKDIPLSKNTISFIRGFYNCIKNLKEWNFVADSFKGLMPYLEIPIANNQSPLIKSTENLYSYLKDVVIILKQSIPKNLLTPGYCPRDIYSSEMIKKNEWPGKITECFEIIKLLEIVLDGKNLNLENIEKIKKFAENLTDLHNNPKYQGNKYFIQFLINMKILENKIFRWMKLLPSPNAKESNKKIEEENKIQSYLSEQKNKIMQFLDKTKKFQEFQLNFLRDIAQKLMETNEQRPKKDVKDTLEDIYFEKYLDFEKTIEILYHFINNDIPLVKINVEYIQKFCRIIKDDKEWNIISTLFKEIVHYLEYPIKKSDNLLINEIESFYEFLKTVIVMLHNDYSGTAKSSTPANFFESADFERIVKSQWPLEIKQCCEIMHLVENILENQEFSLEQEKRLHQFQDHLLSIELDPKYQNNAKLDGFKALMGVSLAEQLDRLISLLPEPKTNNSLQPLVFSVHGKNIETSLTGNIRAESKIDLYQKDKEKSKENEKHNANENENDNENENEKENNKDTNKGKCIIF